MTLKTFDHLCGGLSGPGEMCKSEWVPLPYDAMGTAGIEVARGERGRVAWMRAVSHRDKKEVRG